MTVNNGLYLADLNIYRMVKMKRGTDNNLYKAKKRGRDIIHGSFGEFIIAEKTLAG